MRVVAGRAPRLPKTDAPPTQPVFDLFQLERLLGCVEAPSPDGMAVVQVLDPGSRIELSKKAVLNGQAAGAPSQEVAHVLSNGHGPPC
jgi:hypothetical protein